MTVPISNNQIPQNSILDLNGKQVYLGQAFTLPAAGTSIATTTETPIAVLTNPTTTGSANHAPLSLFLFFRVVSTNNNPILVRSYLNPTLNVPGSATVALNMRSGSAATSISVNYLGATITTNGTLLGTLSASTSRNSSDTLYVLDPGTSLLITAQQAAAGTSLVIPEIVWFEI